MRIFVPFTRLRPQVLVALPDAVFVPLFDEYDYSRYFRERWERQEAFINVEHDVVPELSLLEQMWHCGEPLCVLGYRSNREGASGTSHIGCARIARSVIVKNPGLFDEPCEWIECEGRITGVTGSVLCYHGEALHLKGT